MVIKQLSISTDLKSAYWKSKHRRYAPKARNGCETHHLYTDPYTPQTFTQILLAYLFLNKY